MSGPRGAQGLRGLAAALWARCASTLSPTGRVMTIS